MPSFGDDEVEHLTAAAIARTDELLQTAHETGRRPWNVTVELARAPEDAKGLMVAAIRDLNPVVFLGHKHLYRGAKAEAPEGEHATARKAHELGFRPTVPTIYAAARAGIL